MRKLMTLMALSIAATIALSPVGSAHAATTTTSKSLASGAALIQGRVVTDPDVAQRLIEEYWTPERMRNATPLELPDLVEDPEAERRDRPGNVGAPADEALPAGPSTVTAPSGPSLASVTASPGVGKVFFTDARGEDHACSGSTINNPSQNLVSTAGHCVHPGDGGSFWYQNWAYKPLYHNGVEPFKVWAARQFHSVEGWTKWGFYWWDFAFVTMWPRNGVKLAAATGGQGISFNYSKYSSITLLGYPGKPPFDGESMHFCQGSISPSGSQRVGMKCPLNEGTSGGPFLRNWNNSLGFGFTASAVAHSGPWGTKLYGVYFDDDVKHIYTLVKFLP